MHTVSNKQRFLNFRGQGQCSRQGQTIKMTYFSRKWSVISITTN